MRKPDQSFWGIWNISFGFFGIQAAFALQNSQMSRVFQTLGADISALPILWIAGPVTGLLIQPLVGHFSDRTWGRFGRRRPFFFAGAFVAALALFVMPNAPYLWVAAVGLWILDAAINISMEPFRAFVGDMLPKHQHARGYAMQSVFIGAGALLASFAPSVLTALGVSNVAPEGQIPDSVTYSFYFAGGAIFLAVMWTVISTREYSPEELVQFEDRDETDTGQSDTSAYPKSGTYALLGAIATLLGGALCYWVYTSGLDAQLYVLGGTLIALGLAFLLNAALVSGGEAKSFVSHILGDLVTMPDQMRRLAVVQFFSWFGLFIMFIYAVPAITEFHYGTTDTTSEAYNAGANWWGELSGIYNGVAALFAFTLLPVLARILGQARGHALNLVLGGLGFVSIYLITDPSLLWISTIGIGIAWASILSLPYALLAHALPPEKMGIYMGIFNFFIVIPQLIVSAIMATVLRLWFGNEPIYGFLIAGGCFFIAALATLLVRDNANTPETHLDVPTT